MQSRSKAGIKFYQREPEILFLMNRLLKIVVQFSEKDFFYSDIKPETVLFFKDNQKEEFQIKLLDGQVASTSFMQIVGFTPKYYLNPVKLLKRNPETGTAFPEI